MKRLSLEERKKLEQCFNQGFSCHKTAELCNRSVNACTSELRKWKKTNGNIPYNAIKAQIDCDERNKKRINRISFKNKEVINPFHVRMDNIFLQLDILFEEIKKIKEKLNI